VVSTQSVDDYVALFHSRGSLSPDAMTIEDVQTFDTRLRVLVEPYAEDGQLELQTEATLIWGKPLSNK